GRERPRGQLRGGQAGRRPEGRVLHSGPVAAEHLPRAVKAAPRTRRGPVGERRGHAQTTRRELVCPDRRSALEERCKDPVKPAEETPESVWRTSATLLFRQRA